MCSLGCFLRLVSGLVVGGYGDCRGGGVGGVGLDAPGRFEPTPGGGVVGEGRTEVGGCQRGAEGGQEVHGAGPDSTRRRCGRRRSATYLVLAVSGG